MKTTPFLVLACALAFVGGCSGPTDQKETSPATGPVAANELTQPEGPGVVGVQASGVGATVTPARGTGRFSVKFPVSDGWPAAVFTFAPVDINDRLGMAFEVRNSGREPVRVYADLNGDTWVRGYVTVPPGATRALHVFARRKTHAPAVLEQFPNMHGVPGGKMSLWAGIEEPIIAKELKVFMVQPAQERTIEVGNLRPFGSSKVPDRPDLFPFIDRYGQYQHKTWPGKVRADTDLVAERQREDADLAAHPGPASFNQYGGWVTGPQLMATGHFRVEKVDGKWWLVDPDGRLFWSHGLDCVGFAQSTTSVQGRERFFEAPAPTMGNYLTRNLQTKYGDGWRELTYDRLLQRLRSWGLNTIGGSGDPAVMAKQKVPYTLQVRTGGRTSPVDPDSAAWAGGMRQALLTAAEKTKDDPWCIGFFVDNEIHVSSDPAWWERYYRQVNATAKELIPDKLYLGSRLDYHDWPDVIAERVAIVRLAAKYCDVISFNFYKWTLDDVQLPEGVDRPAIIGEFHMGALDRGPFHTGLRSVLDQEQRAEAYRYYVTSALRNPAFVGAHWFQCYDESTTGRFDGENYQIGFLDICDTPYVETIAAAREVGYRLYTIRRGTK